MSVFKRFKTDQNGATAMMFGLAVMPLMLAAGGAVDYSRAAAVQTQLQRAVDAVAIGLVREPSTTSSADLNVRAQKIFASVYASPDYVRDGSVTATRSDAKIVVRTQASVRNAFMQLVGFDQTAVSAASTSAWGTQRIELALVLDNTGSMDESIGGQRKIDALKSSALQLLSDLRSSATAQDTVKVAIVPFDTEVRLDASAHRNKGWFSWSNASDRAAWTGYVYDRHGSYASTDAAPVAGDSLFPAPRDTEYHTNPVLKAQSTRDLAVMRPLTSLYSYADYNALTTLVGGMQPRGFTNIALGAMWGLATLTPSDPFTEAASLTNKGVKKFMVILTDGDNTMSHVDGKLQTDVTKIDTQTSKACSLVKTDGIEMFTIRLLKGNKNLLKGCASDADHYFDVQNASQLASAFQGIRDAISGTRLTN